VVVVAVWGSPEQATAVRRRATVMMNFMLDPLPAIGQWSPVSA